MTTTQTTQKMNPFVWDRTPSEYEMPQHWTAGIETPDGDSANVVLFRDEELDGNWMVWARTETNDIWSKILLPARLNLEQAKEFAEPWFVSQVREMVQQQMTQQDESMLHVSEHEQLCNRYFEF